MVFCSSVPRGWFVYKMYCFCQVCETGLSGVSGMKNANGVKCMCGEIDPSRYTKEPAGWECCLTTAGGALPGGGGGVFAS